VDTASFKSPEDGSVLSMSVTRRYDGETDFDVSIQTPWFSGKAPASTIQNGSPSGMFSAMATEWRGWKGEKSWQDLDRRVQFTASTDSTGHVKFRVELEGQDYDSHLNVCIGFTAGQLEEIATVVKNVLG
jgi:hypothetical protein